MRNPTKFLKDEYEELVEKSLDWRLKTISGPSEPVSNVDGRDVIVLCSNNYLNLTTHPKLKEAALKAIETHGVGSGAVRAISGTMDLHMELEERLGERLGSAVKIEYSAQGGGKMVVRFGSVDDLERIYRLLLGS